ncbi:flagellar hook-basal body complex protein FliE [Pandoraea apista]|uniref:flagellar hook-basal body complex protein FliE n=1 Tax=Pandoraea apista TaxID=93218 RepID=UPI0021AE09CB|nr:flagellar hook-basal body complex protein FliE [Pandoraea apista]
MKINNISIDSISSGRGEDLIRQVAPHWRREIAGGPNDDGVTGAGVEFAHLLRDMLDDVDHRQVDAERKAAAVDTGRSDDLIGAMLASQDASLSFSMLTQVRNKLVAAFDDLLKMTV